MAFLSPVLRRAGSHFKNDFFLCHPYTKLCAKANPLRTIRFNSNAFAPISNEPAIKSPLASLSTKFENLVPTNISTKAKANTKANFFPPTSSKVVGYWLLGSAASVFGIVVLGGLTRLTESGLSITEWKPVTGSLPPLSQADWDSEFEKYRASPEFHLLNSHMTLPEFKKIYYMEWGHRLWGRFIGLGFVLPAIYFVSRRRVSLPLSLRLLGISCLIGFQGFLGWYMVKSGLKDDLFAPGSHPRVSQYRLAAHLGTAFICYTAMLWNGLAILRTNRLLTTVSLEEAHKLLMHLSSPILSPFRRSVALLAALTFVTALSGAFVAGLDAGLIYNQFPRMGISFHPPKSELLNPSYSRKEDQSDLLWRNMLENPSTAQLDHRILAMSTFTAVLALWGYSRFRPAVRVALPDVARKGMLSVVHMLMVQVTLGISTLIYLVPVPLAAAHQAGALGLLTAVTVLGSRVWIPTRTWALLRKRLQEKSIRCARPNTASVNMTRREALNTL